jgi:hypothetical protein
MAATQNTVRFLVEMFIDSDGAYEQVDQGWYTREEIARKLGTKEWKVTKNGCIWYKQYRWTYDVVLTEKTWVTTPEEEAEMQAKWDGAADNNVQAECDQPIELFTDEEMQELREVHTEHMEETHGCEWDFDDDGYDDFMKFGSLDVYDFKRY